jgi:hypothetical protein
MVFLMRVRQSMHARKCQDMHMLSCKCSMCAGTANCVHMRTCDIEEQCCCPAAAWTRHNGSCSKERAISMISF